MKDMEGMRLGKPQRLALRKLLKQDKLARRARADRTGGVHIRLVWDNLWPKHGATKDSAWTKNVKPSRVRPVSLG